MQREKINLVWFKRDLRLRDHLPLKKACGTSLPVLLVYLFEPSLLNDPHYGTRHWRFVMQSIEEMKAELRKQGHTLWVICEEAEDFFKKLHEQTEINTVYSHEETGIDLTYKRDLALQKQFKKLGITWDESPTNAVQRGLMHRKSWRKTWNSIMYAPTEDPDLHKLNTADLPNQLLSDLNLEIPEAIKTDSDRFQPGGTAQGWTLLESFLHERSARYNESISAPGPARTGCSRLSPYITWGNLSIRQIIHYLDEHYEESASKRGIRSFKSRLGWHCHFIQKFESEPRIEFENLNRGYDDIRTEWNEDHFEAWRSGNTGFPMVDACMRSVIETGYLNFRMRAMLVSFLTHHLWLHWPKGSLHLARQFLDFEPGIHYSQFQMQAGTMGVNTVRIYNPVKQGYDHDPHGDFIREWIPELREVPDGLIHEPWKMSAMEQQMANCIIGENYPEPVITDIKESYKRASSVLWSKKGNAEVKQENKRILKKHVKKRTR